MFMPQDSQRVKQQVRQRYGQLARQGEACCDSDVAAAPGIYTLEEVRGLPAEVLAVSAGSGNPTALAELRAGEVVLDLGSGGGIDCFLSAQKVGSAGRVYGLDMTPDMVAVARRNAERLRLTNVAFLLGEIDRILLQNSSVDVIISNCVLCLSPDRDAVFAEAFRVLRPGGRLHISDMVAHQELPEELRSDPVAWTSCVAGAVPAATYLEQLGETGFISSRLIEQQSEGSPSDVFSARIVAHKPA